MKSLPQQRQRREFQIVIPSRGRSYNVKRLLDIIELDTEFKDRTTFFIPKSQLGVYQKNCKLKCVEYNNIAQKRNIMLDHVHDNFKGSDIIMMDDDLKSIQFARSKKVSAPITFKDMVDYIYESLEFHKGLKVAGVPQIANLFYYNPHQPFSTLNFVVSNFYLIKKDNKLRFDENLDVKSDYDYTLQNIFTYGGALRCNCVLAKFDHWNNKGGLTGIRTVEKALNAIDYLKNKWGSDIIKRNKKEGKETEILLRVNRSHPK